MTLLPEAIATGSIGDFAVIPVLDLKDGLVVHARAGKQARAGKRAEYRPLATPFGPLGFAVNGTGNLSGGFKGRLAIASPRLIPGRCAATNLRANVAVGVVARRPRVDGPVTLDRFACPARRPS